MVADAITVHTPLCRDCNRLAAGFVRWPQHRVTDSPWTPECDQHVPWHNPDALVVGIRHITPDHYDPPADDPAAPTDPDDPARQHDPT